MPEVLIEHCTLRLVRHSGWSWGPDPKGLVAAALRALPMLLARQLESLFGDDDDRTYEAPVRITLPLRASDLSEAAPDTSGLARASQSQDTVPLERRLDMVLRAALGMSAAPEDSKTEIRPDSQPRFQPLEEGARPLDGPCGAIGHVLLSRLASKDLEQFLAAFTIEELEAWHKALTAAPRQLNEEAGIAGPVLEEVLTDTLAVRAFPQGSGHAGLLRLRLALATTAAAATRVPLDSVAIWQALDRLVTLPEPAPASVPMTAFNLPAEETSAARPVQLELAGVARVAAATDQTRLLSARQRREWTTQVHSALPFLLLGPLARIGYLETLSAALEVAHLTNQAPLFAAAFAYKSLEPPARGWLRSEAARHTAAVFAGSREPIPDEALMEFSRQMAPHTGVLNRQIEESVLKGRDAALPVLLCRAESERLAGYLLVDTGGCFPIAWVEDALGAVMVLQRLPSPVVVVTQDASGPQVLKELNSAGIPFVTEVPPLKDESWHRVLRGVTRLGWTNHAEASAEPILRAAGSIPVSSEETSGLWDKVGRHGAVPRAPRAELECALLLAVSTALGIVAWQLWKEHGRTTPQLALERLGDLEGRVRFQEDMVSVGLPLGRRRSELEAGGLLAPVRGVPWLNGRRLEFLWG